MLLNRLRADEYMRRHNLDALIATSPVNVTYLTGYHCWLDPVFKKYMMTPGATSDPLMETFALLPRGGTPCLIVSSLFAVNAADLDCAIYTYGDPGYDRAPITEDAPNSRADLLARLGAIRNFASATQALAEAAHAFGLSQSRIGLEKEHLPMPVAADLAAALSKAFLPDCTNLIRLVRMVKSEEELRRLRKAAGINENAAQRAFALAEPGIRMSALRAEYAQVVQQNGALFEHFAFGLSGFGIASEPSYTLEGGEVLYVDFGCVWSYYLSDSGTTLALGRPGASIVERHRWLRESLETGKQHAKPGARPSDVQAAMARVLEAHGISSFPHGHGLGLEPRDYPIIVPESGLRVHDDCVDEPADVPIEAGMVLNFEASVFMPGVASLNTEETVLVTEHGCQILIPHDRSTPVVSERLSGRG